jgi:hypothetical protein
MSILGMAAIRINGREIKTEGKSTLNPGGKHAPSIWAAARSGAQARWRVPRSR